MATITQNIADIAGFPDNEPWIFYTEIREGSDEDSIVSTQRVRVYPVAGVLTVELDPGPAIVTFLGHKYEFTVPDADSDLWSLIETGVGIPPETAQDRIQDAVDAYFVTHPVDVLGWVDPIVARDGTTDDRSGLSAANTTANAGGLPIMLKKGTHRVASNLTITAPVIFQPGAKIKPDNGVTVTLSGGLGNTVHSQVFDQSAGGVVIPKLVDYYLPEWWGSIKQSDDSATWQAMLKAINTTVAAAIAGGDGPESMSGFYFGQRILAPAGVNRVNNLVLRNCEVVAGRGWSGFAPPTADTSGVMLTLLSYAELTGGWYGSSNTGQTLIWQKGARTSLNGDVYINPDHANVNALIAGSTLQKTVTINGSPSAASYKLTVDGQETAVAFSLSSTAAAIKTALENLSNLEPGDVAVSGSAGGPYTVFVPGTLTVTSTSFTGGTSPSISVSAGGSTTPVANIVHINSGQTPPSGTIGVDIQSPDCKINELWIGQTEIGIKGTNAGAAQLPSIHIWGCGTGITGDQWDKSAIAGWVESCLGWGVDVDKVDFARWDLLVWNNGATTAGTGGARFQQTSSAARECILRLILDDNTGTGLVLDGPDDYDVTVSLRSSKVKVGQTSLTTTGVSITSACLRTRLALYGTDVTTTVLDDSSTSTIYKTVSGNTHVASSKTTPVDADEIPLGDSTTTGPAYGLTKLTWANLKATLATWLTTLTATWSNKTLTSPVVNGGKFDTILDSNGLTVLGLTATASAVNRLAIANAATGVVPLLTVAGDTNIGFDVRGKGTGLFGIRDATTSTKAVRFDPSGVTANRIWGFPDAADTFVGATAAQTLSGKTLTNPTITNYTESVVAIGNSGTTQTISLTSGTVQTVTLTGNCVFTMPTATAGKSFALYVNTGAGSFTATFTGVKWPAATAPTITTTAARLDIITFVSDGTNWYGAFTQNYTP